MRDRCPPGRGGWRDAAGTRNPYIPVDLPLSLVLVCESSRTLAQIPVTMGYKQSSDSNLAYAGFDYSTSSSTTLGAGISYTSASGGFSADGTTTQTAGGSWTFPNLPGAGNNDFNGDGIYYDQEYLCYMVGNYSTYWLLTQHDVAGEKGTPGASPVSVGKCVTTLPGTTNIIHSGKQETFGAGVQLGSLGFGVNLSSQDGWSTQSELTYKMGSAGHPLCGSSDYPGSPGYVGVVGVH